MRPARSRWVMGAGINKAPSTLLPMLAPLPASFPLPPPRQIDVFIRQNYTADSNAMGVILCELFADAEAAQASSLR